MATLRNASGFTLIELLVTIAIVGILAAIAYPSYRDQVLKSRRAEGKGLLLETAQALEKCRALYGAYDNPNCQIVGNITLGNSILSAEGFYSVSASTGPNPATFTLEADPQQPDPKCEELTLDQAGTQGENGTGTVDDCW